MPQRPSQLLNPIASDAIPDDVQVSQRLALFETDRQPSRSLIAQDVESQVEMPQRRALAEHRCEMLHPVRADVVVPKVEMSQRLA